MVAGPASRRAAGLGSLARAHSRVAAAHARAAYSVPARAALLMGGTDTVRGRLLRFRAAGHGGARDRPAEGRGRAAPRDHRARAGSPAAARRPGVPRPRAGAAGPRG